MSLKLGGGIRPITTRHTIDSDTDNPYTAALCRDEDPELFFPIGKGDNADWQYERARQVCNRCPLRERCLTDSLDRGDEYGMFGGATPEERKDMRAPKPTRPCLACDEPFEPSRPTQSTCTPCQMRSRAGGVTQLDAFLRKFGDELRQAARAGVTDKAFAEYLGVSHYLVGRARAALGIPSQSKANNLRGAGRRVGGGV